MSDIIRLLPDSVANQIAAGEVIQRPASVVKELVENAIDAGADDVKIVIRDAGRTLIQVIDNGCGMSDTDARMAFERHATSKISRADDLFSLNTMGFRGEALASIAAVAQVELRTMSRDSDVGTKLLINGSVVESQEPEACVPGCNMMVKNLFFNVPARRKFLKKDAVELNNIMREFERLALVNPDVDMTLIHNDSVLHKLRRGSFKKRISELFGIGIEKQIIEVGTSISIVSIDGFIGRPEHARRRNALQFLFVNGRHMRHPYFHKAIMQCYEQIISADEQPNYFINFKVDPATIDVNIHPTKNEIKFENESAIWQILVAAVRESLGRFNAVPGIDFSTDAAPEIPIFNPNADAPHGVEIDPTYNPFNSQPRQSPSLMAEKRRNAQLSDWQKLYDGFNSQSATTGVDSILNNVLPDTELPLPTQPDTAEGEGASLIQVKDKFIFMPSKSGVMVVDRYRASVKVLYERFMAMWNGQSAFTSQRILFPEVVTLTAAQSALLEAAGPDVTDAGFDLAYLGDNSWSINGLPSVIGDANPVETLMLIVENATDETTDDASSDIRHRVTLAMAKAAAVKTGQTYSNAEAEHLVNSLLSLTTPNYTPDGNLILSIIPITDIEKIFR